MKRYILFGGSDFYYASGGAHDFVKSSEMIDDLVLYAITKSNERYAFGGLVWWHIFDVIEGIIVRGTKEQAYGASNLDDDISIN